MTPQKNIIDILSLSWSETNKRFVPLMCLAGVVPLVSYLANLLLPEAQNAAGQINWISILSIFVFTALSGYCTAALILLAARRVHTPGQALQAAWRPFWRMLAGSIILYIALTVVGIVLGLIVFVTLAGLPDNSSLLFVLAVVEILLITALILTAAVYLSLFPYVLVLTDTPIFSSFLQSFRLIKNAFWKTTGLLFLLGLISGAVLFLAGLLLGILSFILSLVLPVLANVMGLLMVPVTAGLMAFTQVTVTLFYLERSQINRQVPTAAVPPAGPEA